MTSVKILTFTIGSIASKPIFTSASKISNTIFTRGIHMTRPHALFTLVNI